MLPRALESAPRSGGPATWGPGRLSGVKRRGRRRESDDLPFGPLNRRVAGILCPAGRAERVRDAHTRYATLAYEATHWTAYESRLARDLGTTRFGADGYARAG